MIMYHMMYTKTENGTRIVQVMDFRHAQMIRFDMSDYYEEKLPQPLKEFIDSVKKDIEEGKWDQNYT